MVAFDIACLRDLVTEQTGRVVAPFDVEAYAAALLEVCADPGLRARLGAAGHDRVRHLTWDAAAQAQAQVYRTVLGGSA